MSPVSILQGKLCGLCGNNNLDNSDDMMTLDSQLMSSSRLFVMDNLLPSSQCDANDYQTQLALRHEGRQSYWLLVTLQLSDCILLPLQCFDNVGWATEGRPVCK